MLHVSCRYHRLERDASLLENTDVLPPPIAADLNGDGRMEIITATHDAHLHVRKDCAIQPCCMP